MDSGPVPGIVRNRVAGACAFGLDVLRDGIPQAILEAGQVRKEISSGEAKFLPVAIKAAPIEIEFPNRMVVRLPLDMGRPLLLEVIRVAAALRPWRPSKS